MPRGNDASAAASELHGQYGEHQNAEDLIRAHREGLDRDVQRASLRAIDQGATDNLDLDSIKVERGERVLSASVRGGVVIAVIEDAEGRTRKETHKLPDKAAKASTASKQQAGGPKQAGDDPEAEEKLEAERAKVAEKAAAEQAAADKAAEKAAAEQGRPKQA